MKLYVILYIFLCFSNIAVSQDFTSSATVDMGPKVLKLNEPFVISVKIHGAENRPAVIFPDIQGFEKRSRSATSAINNVDGEKVVIQTISQEYFVSKVGKYVIPELTILINTQKIKEEGTIITVVSETGETDHLVDENDPYLQDVELGKEDVFLSIKTDKKSVFVQEGFAFGISLYIAESAAVQMEFFDFNNQLQSILKKIHPANCWEENVGLEEIVKRQVTIRGKKYTEYNMYQAHFFPLTLQDVVFPPIALNMLVVENKNAVNVQHKVVRTYTSNAVKIKVKPLPPHPLKDQIAVGQYALQENLSNAVVYPGESVRYMFKIAGTGNIGAVPAPTIEDNSTFDFYPPDRSHEIVRSNSKVSGQVSFDYFIVPRKDGNFPLGRYFQWIYFDPVVGKYDTLRSAKKLQVKGEDYRLGNISLSGSLGLYDNLDVLDTTKTSFNYKRFFRDITNALVIVLICAMIWVFRK